MLDPLVAATATDLAEHSGSARSVRSMSSRRTSIGSMRSTAPSMRSRCSGQEAILADAAQLDALSQPAGPLRSLPVAVKDLEDVAVSNLFGLDRDLDSTLPRASSLVASRLQAAEAVIISETNTRSSEPGAVQSRPRTHPQSLGSRPQCRWEQWGRRRISLLT